MRASTRRRHSGRSSFQLEEDLVWQRRNYERAIERVKHMLEHVLNTDLPQVLRWEERYEKDRIGSTRGADDVASDIVHMIDQALPNMDFRGLIKYAGDVARTEYALVALAEFRASLPTDLREALEAAENTDAADRKSADEADTARREKEIREQCTHLVHEQGRGVGSRRCLRKGSVLGPDGKLYCKPHAEKAARHAGSPSLASWAVS